MVIENECKDEDGVFEKIYEYTWSPLLEYSYYSDVTNQRVFTTVTGEAIEERSWGFLMDALEEEEWKPVVTPLG